jgi:hypothetical protein
VVAGGGDCAMDWIGGGEVFIFGSIEW